MRPALVIVFACTLVACMEISNSRKSDEVAQTSTAAASIRAVQADSSLNLLRNKEVLPNQEIAIAVAEPILFHIYGKALIIDERPYNAVRSGDHWVIEGHIDDGMLGGVFEIILSAKDARVIKISHGR